MEGDKDLTSSIGVGGSNNFTSDYTSIFMLKANIHCNKVSFTLLIRTLRKERRSCNSTVIPLWHRHRNQC